MKFFYLFVILFLFCVLKTVAYSKEDYLTKTEFFILLSRHYSLQELDSIYDSIPDDLQIWGYDIGDYTGDGVPDFAFSFRTEESKDRNMNVFFFIKKDSSLQKIFETQLKYYRLPIEIGINIVNNECQITHKVDEDYWEFKSYTLKNGNFLLTSYYESKTEVIKGSRRKFVGYERFLNYTNALITENFYELSSSRKYFRRKYFFLPAYHLDEKIFKDYSVSIIDTNSTFITSGYLSWRDKNDLSISFRSGYNDSCVKIFFYIKDDSLLIVSKKIMDYIVLWIDNTPDRLIYTKPNGVYVREGFDNEIKKISIFFDNNIRMEFYNENEQLIIDSISAIRHSFIKFDNGYYKLIIEIPIEMMPNTVGFGWQYIDYDSPNEEPTVMSSALIEDWNPSSFGVLQRIPRSIYWGEVINHELPKVLSELEVLGLGRIK